jgi:hypothetical protein
LAGESILCLALPPYADRKRFFGKNSLTIPEGKCFVARCWYVWFGRLQSALQRDVSLTLLQLSVTSP